jgi:hypothetical protein
MVKHFIKNIVAGMAICSFTAPVFAWTVNMNFDNSLLGSVGGFTDAAGLTKVTSALAYSGSKSAELNITAGCYCYGTWGGLIAHPTLLKKGDQVWFRVRTYMPIGFNYDSSGEGSHLKFLRIHTQSALGSNEGYNDWYINPKGSATSHKFIFEGEQVWDQFASSAYAPVLGKWETYEFYVKLDNVSVSNGGTARVRVWKDGVLLKDITNRKTLASATSVSDRTHLFTYWNGGSPATQKMYVDDIVLTSDTPAGRDAKGNPYVGAGSATGSGSPTISPPSAPVLKVQ